VRTLRTESVTHVGSVAAPLLTRRLASWLAALAAAVTCLLAVAHPWPGAIGTSAPATSSAGLSGDSAGAAAIPLAARLSISGTIGAENAQFRIVRSGGGLLAGMEGAMSARFGPGGASVSAGTLGVLRLGPTALGRGGTLQTLRPVAPVARRNRVSYAYRDLSAWFVNGPLGLEQGFTIPRRPAGAGQLDLTVGSFPAHIRPLLEAGGRSVTILDSAGRALARYGGLRVTDATGRALAARIAVQGRQLLLRIDDRGARYPLRIDPWVLSATLTGTGLAPAPNGESFGTAIAVSANGKVLAVGVPNSNLVYVFTRPSSGSWKNAHQTAVLEASPESNLGSSMNPAYLGSSVAISSDGSTIVTGAPNAYSGVGAVLVYTEPSNGWKHTSGQPKAELQAGQPEGPYDFLGASVAINGAGTEIAAGAPEWNNEEGALYLARKPSHGWENEVIGVYANVGEAQANSAYGGVFGATIAISSNGDTLVVGAPWQSGWEGAVYVFALNTGGYKELPDTASGTADQFFICDPNSAYGIGNPELGQSVAISADGKTIVAGEPCAGTGGQAVVYDEPSGGWLKAGDGITAGLTPLRPQVFNIQQLGWTVAISGDGNTIAAEDPDYNAPGGFVATFAKPSGGWSHVNPPDPKNFSTIITPDDDASGIRDDVAGTPVAISSDGGTIFIGTVSASGQGAVDVYTPQLRNAKVSVSCNPSSVKLNSGSVCTATTKDTGSGASTPTGTVSFSSNGGSAGKFNHSKCTLSGGGGTAKCHVTFTPGQVRVFTITADYSGDSRHKSGKATTTVTVPKSPTHTSISCTPSTVSTGVKSTCTVTVTGVGAHPPRVSLKTSAGTLSGETCSTSGTTETCTVSFSSNSAGSDKISAAYPDDSTDESSSASTTVVVTNLPATTTSVSCPASVTSGMQSTCTATTNGITGPASPPDIGFSASPSGLTIGSASCTFPTPSEEQCTVTVSSTEGRTYTLTASFLGDTDAAPSSGTAPIAVLDPTTTSVACTRESGGTEVSCTATVMDTSSTPTTPTGTVTWSVTPTPSTPAAACTLTSSSSSTATCSTTFPANARLSYNATGNYGGDATHKPSSGGAQAPIG